MDADKSVIVEVVTEESVIVEAITEESLIAQAIDERSHPDIEMAVNRGIAAAILEGVPEGLRIMEEAGIPKNISVRVLNSKTRRRASDWK